VRLNARGVEDHIIVQVIDLVNSYSTTGCAGQHLDLSFNSEIGISENAYFDIISMKSAAQIECACHIGAFLATSNEELIKAFVVFGHNLGMAAQITNDIQGVLRKSDIIKRKITLPVIFALAQTEGEVRYQLELAFDKQSESIPNTTKIRDLLFHCGAIHYATVKMEFYRQRALDILAEIEKAGARVERLKLFL
jgi:geranylgeranyl pyrophosphate synthase